MRLTYHGHSAVQLDSDAGSRLLIDPWIVDNPHCTATLDSFTDVDAVLVTHAAYDHLGDAPEIAERNDAELICDSATGMKLEADGFPESQLRSYIWGPEYDRDDWRVKVLEAHHQSAVSELNLVGEALAYIVSMDGERVYHLGDTSLFGDIRLFAEQYQPTVGLVPVGEARDWYTELHPDEAALVTEWLDAGVVVPMHYRPGSDNPEAFREHCRDRGVDETTNLAMLDPGETIDFS